MIQEIQLNGLDNKPIKQQRNHHQEALICYFTSIFIGSKGSGKTYSLIKLLKITKNTLYMIMKAKN